MARQTDGVITLGAGTLTCEDVCSIARTREPVGLSTAVISVMDRGHAAAVELAARAPVYGRSTAVGALLGEDAPDPGGVQDGRAAGLSGDSDLLRSHGTTAGPALPPDLVRAMTVVRVEQIAAGSSGLGSATAAALVDALNADSLPTVGRFHSLGTGDIAPLARLALSLPAGSIDHGDGLALMSSNALSIGRSALSVVDLGELLEAATVIAALTFLARDGSGEAIDPRAAGPFPGPRRVAATLRRLGAGQRPAARLQDQFGMRTAPQTIGIGFDQADQLRRVVTALATAGLENPLIIADPSPTAVHHGGFHAVHLTAALDAATLALARTAIGSTNRLTLLAEPSPPPAPRWSPVREASAIASAEQGRARPFLATGAPSASGIMVLEYTAAAALGVVRAAAVPAGLLSADLSRGVEQDAGHAPLAAEQLADAIDAARVVIGIELVAAVRALRLRRVLVPAPLASVWEQCEQLPNDHRDRDLTADLRTAERLLPTLARLSDSTVRNDGAGPPRPE